jgi:hypothetical protein
MIDDEIARQFLLLVDGTRTVDQLVVDLADKLEQAGLADKDKVVTRADVEHHLGALSRLALIMK